MRVFQNILNMLLSWESKKKKQNKQPQLHPYLITHWWDNGLVDHDDVVSEGAKSCQHIKLTNFRLSESSVESEGGRVGKGYSAQIKMTFVCSHQTAM